MPNRGILRTHSELPFVLMQGFDVCVIMIAAILAHRFYLGEWMFSLGERLIVGLVVLLSLFLFPKFGLYRSHRDASIYAEVRGLTAVWALVFATLAACLFLNKVGADYSRMWIGLWAAGAWLVFVLARVLLRVALRWMRMHGYNVWRTVIVGEGDFAHIVAQRLAHSPWTGIKVVGQFADRVSAGSQVSYLGRLADLAAFVDAHDIDQVWLVMSLREEDKVQYLLHELRYSTVDIRYVPDLFAFKLLNHSISEVEGLPVMDLSATPMTPLNRLVKRIEDQLVASLVLLAIAPLMVLIAFAIKWQSRGPVFFVQKRLGWDGKPFMVYKFRTMLPGPEPQQYRQAKKGDPRITPLGAFLRRTSLDELPQFINVLQGRMSIVGPRPHPLGLNEQYKDQVSRYMWRHKVKPGITGWAQINGWRGETDTVEKMRKRIEYDLYYIENWSLLFDLRIILMTIIKGFSNENAY